MNPRPNLHRMLIFACEAQDPHIVESLLRFGGDYTGSAMEVQLNITVLMLSFGWQNMERSSCKEENVMNPLLHSLLSLEVLTAVLLGYYLNELSYLPGRLRRIHGESFEF
jgi:hypothetical protein